MGCVAPAAPAAPPAEPDKGDEASVPQSNTETISEQPASARVTVRLPAEAALYVDGVLCTLTSENRSFQTPPLKTDRKYFYNLRMVHTVNGEEEVQNRKIILSAGQHVQVGFGKYAPALTVSR